MEINSLNPILRDVYITLCKELLTNDLRCDVRSENELVVFDVRLSRCLMRNIPSVVDWFVYSINDELNVVFSYKPEFRYLYE